MNNKVLTVTFDNKPINIESKENVHKLGKLHRAFSIYIFNSENEILLQKRAMSKYHSGGKWSNSCCSHPVSDDIIGEANQRLFEELGFKSNLRIFDSFIYYSELNNGYKEFEYDYILIGEYANDSSSIYPNLNEVEKIKWVTIDWVYNDISKHPEKYTNWFITGLSILINKQIGENYGIL